MRLRIVWVGKGRDRLLAAVVERYVERLSRFTSVEVRCVPEARGQGLAAAESRRIEGQRVRDALTGAADRGGRSRETRSRAAGRRPTPLRSRDAPGTRATVALDERGDEVTSRQLAELIAAFARGGRQDVAFVVGGDEGLDAALIQEADRVLSLSRLTLTHELARVVLVEQLYRAHAILSGHPYHRDGIPP